MDQVEALDQALDQAHQPAALPQAQVEDQVEDQVVDQVDLEVILVKKNGTRTRVLIQQVQNKTMMMMIE